MITDKNNDNYDTLRDMANKPIEETYKGILRVSNNINLKENDIDKFLNENYYIKDEDDADKWFGNGINTTHYFLSETESVKRFRSTDNYTNLKLPVTDSMGNYLNFSLGCDSSLIGWEPATGIIDLIKGQFQSETDSNTFPAVDAKIIYLGLSERVKKSLKTATGANLEIESSETIPGVLAIKNDKVQGEVDTNYQYRTIFEPNKKPKYEDALIHRQENYKKKGECIDSYVNFENLKDYVAGRVEEYFRNNNVTIPTGTIISQYCNLDKWYCIDLDNVDESSELPHVRQLNDGDWWEGYRPAMQVGPKTPYAYFNIIQNGAYKSEAYLYNGGYTNDFLTSELPPDFKRGYVLCDGKGYTIHLYPNYIQGVQNMQKSLDLFFNLFYILGYYYHNDAKLDPSTGREKKIPPQPRRVFHDESAKTYRFYSNYGSQRFNDFEKADNDVLYAIDMATILIFKAFNEHELFDNVNEAIDWLKGLKISDDYIFNAIFPNSLQTDYNSYYNYTPPSSIGKIISINVGATIDSFDCEIPYYIFDDNKMEYQLTTCKIWEMAEAYDIASLFVNKKNMFAWNNYNFTFYVPQMYTYTDSEVNSAYGGKATTIGQFIGSNGCLIADKLNLKNKNITVDLSKSYTTFEGNFNLSTGYLPHAHAIGKGSIKFSRGDAYDYSFTAYKTDGTSIQDAEYIDTKGNRKLEKLTLTDGNKISHENITNKNIIATDYRTTKENIGWNEFATDNMLNYILQEVQMDGETKNWSSDEYGVKKKVVEPCNDAKVVINFNNYNGLPGYEWQSSISSNYKWHGRTSEPIWLNAPEENNTTEKTNLGYFRPESIKLLPLIKL